MINPLLCVGTKIVPATTETFHTKEKFILKEDGGIFSNLSGSFKEDYLQNEGLIEDQIQEHLLYEYQLQIPISDSKIIKRFGGKVKVESTMAGMFYLMEKNILSGDKVHVFYIKNMCGILRAVYIRGYRNDGWNVFSDSTVSRSGWSSGDMAFSRNPLTLICFGRLRVFYYSKYVF